MAVETNAYLCFRIVYTVYSLTNSPLSPVCDESVSLVPVYQVNPELLLI